MSVLDRLLAGRRWRAVADARERRNTLLNQALLEVAQRAAAAESALAALAADLGAHRPKASAAQTRAVLARIDSLLPQGTGIDHIHVGPAAGVMSSTHDEREKGHGDKEAAAADRTKATIRLGAADEGR